MTLTRSSTALRGGAVFKRTAPRTIAHSRVSPPEPVRDKRYGLARWRKVRLRVLVRDGYRCRIAPDCLEPATVADHIEPVHPGMADSLFFDPRNLRAACRPHNLDRGKVARFLREVGDVG